jgi:hypothetical protein
MNLQVTVTFFPLMFLMVVAKRKEDKREKVTKSKQLRLKRKFRSRGGG